MMSRTVVRYHRSSLVRPCDLERQKPSISFRAQPRNRPDRVIPDEGIVRLGGFSTSASSSARSPWEMGSIPTPTASACGRPRLPVSVGLPLCVPHSTAPLDEASPSPYKEKGRPSSGPSLIVPDTASRRKIRAWGVPNECIIQAYRRFRLLSFLRSRCRRRRARFFFMRFSSDGFMYAMFWRYSRRIRLRLTWRRKRLSARSMSSFPRTFTPTAKVDPSLRSLVRVISLGMSGVASRLTCGLLRHPPGHVSASWALPLRRPRSPRSPLCPQRLVWCLAPATPGRWRSFAPCWPTFPSR